MVRRWLAFGVVVTLAVIGVVMFQRSDESDEYWCAGVGLINTPSGDSPFRAMNAFLPGWEPADWHDVGDGMLETDRPEQARGYERLLVDEVAAGEWKVTGACVGPPPIP